MLGTFAQTTPWGLAPGHGIGMQSGALQSPLYAQSFGSYGNVGQPAIQSLPQIIQSLQVVPQQLQQLLQLTYAQQQQVQQLLQFVVHQIQQVQQLAQSGLQSGSSAQAFGVPFQQIPGAIPQTFGAPGGFVM